MLTRPEANGHNPARLCSRTVFPIPTARDQKRVTRIKAEFQRRQEAVATGCANLDAVNSEPAMLRAGRRDLTKHAGLRVLLKEPIQPDDRRPIARELVVCISKK